MVAMAAQAAEQGGLINRDGTMLNNNTKDSLLTSPLLGLQDGTLLHDIGSSTSTLNLSTFPKEAYVATPQEGTGLYDLLSPFSLHAGGSAANGLGVAFDTSHGVNGGKIEADITVGFGADLHAVAQADIPLYNSEPLFSVSGLVGDVVAVGFNIDVGNANIFGINVPVPVSASIMAGVGVGIDLKLTPTPSASLLEMQFDNNGNATDRGGLLAPVMPGGAYHKN